MTYKTNAPRSFLFVPGDVEKRFDKALQSGADAVILDLEDAVAESKKSTARQLAANFLSLPTKARRYIRINGLGTEHCWQDLAAIVRPGLDGIVLPKFETDEMVRQLDWLLHQFERDAGLASGAIEVIPLVESAVGFTNLARLDGPMPRVDRMTFGAVDLSRDLSVELDEEERQLDVARWAIVLASKTAKLSAPIDTVFVSIANVDGYKNSARKASRSGFSGKLCIHPSQVPMTNSAFAPDAEEIASARRILHAAAEAPGSGAVRVDGKMVDKPIIDQARALLAQAEEAQAETGDDR